MENKHTDEQRAKWRAAYQKRKETEHDKMNERRMKYYNENKEKEIARMTNYYHQNREEKIVKGMIRYYKKKDDMEKVRELEQRLIGILEGNLGEE